MRVEYTYHVCQDCDFIGGSFDFSFIDDSDGGYGVDFHCPKCGSINVKKRMGITDVEMPSMKIEELIRASAGRGKPKLLRGLTASGGNLDE